jgi:hypothetical protein
MRQNMAQITAATVGDLRALIPDFERSLRAANKSPKTVVIYREAANRLVEFLLAAGMPTNSADIHREHIEAPRVESLASWRRILA